jgi:hypothetical protein
MLLLSSPPLTPLPAAPREPPLSSSRADVIEVQLCRLPYLGLIMPSHILVLLCVRASAFAH